MFWKNKKRESVCNLSVAQADNQKDETVSQETVSVIAHQLRAPLSAIRLTHQLLLENTQMNLTAKQLHLIQQAELCADRMVLLTDTLLAPEQLKSYLTEVALTKGIIEDTLQEVVDEMGARIEHKELQVYMDLSPQRESILYDEVKMYDVFVNLLDNAIKYTPAKGAINVATSYTDSHIQIAIADTGVGIPDICISKIFQKFQQVENSNVNNSEGVGLGLYIAKVIIEQHNGTLQYTHNDPTGSVFTTVLPRVL